MKNRKKMVPMLIAAAMLLVPSISARASDANYVEVDSGSTTAKVSFSVENVMALEATASTGKKTGFKVKNIEVSGTESGSLVQKSAEGDQVVVVGNNIPADLKLTVSLESSSPMKDGAYTVTLKYATTNKSGTFSTGKTQTATIYVGIEAPEESEAEEKSSSSASSGKKNTNSSNETASSQATASADDEESDRADMLGVIDYSALRAALAEAEELKNKDLTSEQLERLLSAIEAGNAALESDSQEEVDQAAADLEELIEEYGDLKDAVVKKKSSSSFKNLWIILLISLLIFAILLAVLIWYLLKKKRAKNDEEGAPMVDYDISDDDDA